MMSRARKVISIVISLAMLVCAVLLMRDPQIGMFVVAMVLGVVLLLYGIRTLAYYITMARHMTGGLSLLFMAVICIDMGLFALVLASNPRFSIVLYLVGYNAVAGILGIMRAMEARSFESHWRLALAHGIVNVLFSVACVVFLGSDSIIITIFCAGLVYRAIMRMIMAVRRTEIIYIQ